MNITMRFTREQKQLAVAIAMYVLCFFWLAYRRFMVFGWDTGDFGSYHDMFWWTFRGKPFLFAPRGYSILGVHAEFLWIQLLPVLWLFPGVPALIFMQSLAIGMAGVPLYLIARKLFGDHTTALLLMLAFLFFPPIVSQHVNQVEAAPFIAVYLLFAFYFYMCKRFGLFMLFAVIACLGRENVSLAIAMFGVYTVLQRRGWKWILTPPALCAVYFPTVTFVVMPWFRQGVQWETTARMFRYLGSSTGEIVTNALTNPGLVLNHLWSAEIIQYVLFLVQPLAWVLPFLSPACLLALPDLALNTVSDNNALRVIGWHYNVVTGSVLFVSAVLGMKKVAGWLRRRLGGEEPVMLMAAALVVLSLAHWYLWFNLSQYRRLPEHDTLVRALQIVPRDKSILVPNSLPGHVCGRAHWDTIGAFQDQPEYAAQYEFVLVDVNERRFNPPMTREFFESLYRNPQYQLRFAENGVFVFQRSGGESDWKIPWKPKL